MNLKELLKDVEILKVIGGDNLQINSLHMDSRSVLQSSLYFAIKGYSDDGHSYAYLAASKGAVAIVCEREVPVMATQVVVKDVRMAMAQISSNFYGNPAKKLKLIGVTGTNGKTTTTYIIKSICEAAGEDAAIIGTNGCFIKDKFLPSLLTTPDPIELNRMLALMVSEGVKICAMEVSAHAIALKKLYGLEFEAGVFTNLSQDHLDFFDTMYNYRNTKISFFSSGACKYILTNSDDECGREIARLERERRPPGSVITYGCDNPSDVFAIDVEHVDTGSRFVANIKDQIINIETALYGKFNIYNILAAASACAVIGIKPSQIAAGVRNIREIDGRFNVIDSKRGYKIIIDYAHSPGGIKNVLGSARAICYGRLICVFGCGGNRDKSKRKYMGKAVSDIADFCVITSDNPRFEDPMAIINDIENGVKKQCSSYICIENRKKAITYALITAKKGDVVAILGKGGERYQEIAGVKYPYNDRETVNNILKDI